MVVTALEAVCCCWLRHARVACDGATTLSDALLHRVFEPSLFGPPLQTQPAVERDVIFDIFRRPELVDTFIRFELPRHCRVAPWPRANLTHTGSRRRLESQTSQLGRDRRENDAVDGATT